MAALSEKISNLNTGPEIQKKQEELITELDRLIAKQKTKEQEGNANSNPNSNDLDKKAGDKEFAAKKELQRKEFQKDWDANMTDRERKAALQAISGLPMHYRDLINQYYKALAETKSTNKK
jgi:DNA primase catalytic subunit